MQLPFHSIADDYHQYLIVHRAVTQAREYARSAFLFGMDDGLDDVGLDLLASEAWNAYRARITFDYPRYAHTLFHHAYHLAFRTYMRNLANGHPTEVEELTSAILATNERRLPPSSAS